jgi:hypothetical protein
LLDSSAYLNRMFARLFHTTNPIKIDAKVVSHGRYVAFQMAEGRHPTANVPGDFAPDRGTTTATATSASDCVFQTGAPKNYSD